MLRQCFSPFALLSLLALLVGCNKEEGAPVPVFAARGKVLFLGKPIQGARVLLHPVDSAASPIRPRGVTGEDGTFILTSFFADDGAPAGDYKVTISWKYFEKAELEKAVGIKESEDGDLAPEHLPKRYQNPQTSGIEVTVSEGNNEFPPFQLAR